MNDFKCRELFRIILNYARQLDNVTRPSGVRIESESQIHQLIEVKNTNDLILEVRHYKPTNKPLIPMTSLKFRTSDNRNANCTSGLCKQILSFHLTIKADRIMRRLQILKEIQNPQPCSLKLITTAF